jgi:hypothetical protein
MVPKTSSDPAVGGELPLFIGRKKGAEVVEGIWVWVWVAATAWSDRGAGKGTGLSLMVSR